MDPCPAPIEELKLRTIQDAIFGRNAQALDQLYRTYNPLVGEAIRACVGSMPRVGHYASELQSEVWLRLLDSDQRLLRSYAAGRGPFGAFLQAVAIDTAARAAASTDLCEHESVLSGANPDHACDGDRSLERWLEDADYVQRLLDAVEEHGAPNDRVMLECMAVYGMSASELAQRLTVSRDAIYIRKSRLRKNILPVCVARLADPDVDSTPATAASLWNPGSPGRTEEHRQDDPTRQRPPRPSLVAPRRKTRPQQSAYNAGHVPPDPPNPARPRAGYRLRQRQGRSPQG